MPLIYQNSANGPGTHALVIGVSHYPHLDDGEAPTPFGQRSGLDQLSSAARSAAEFAAWLLNEYHHPERPLLSLRVALSPAVGEILPASIAALLPTDHAATRAQVEMDFIAFRDACAEDTNNIAFVYIAGHGVQLTNHGAIVLLEDFAAPRQATELYGAIDVANVHASMNRSGTAQTQFWFSDACRQTMQVMKIFETLTGAFSQSVLKGAVANASPLFLSAITGTQAYGIAGGRSLFCEGLLWALREGGAAEGPRDAHPLWRVTVAGLIAYLPAWVKALAHQYGESQDVDPVGRIGNAVLHYYPRTPKSQLLVKYAGTPGLSSVDLLLNASSPVITGSTDCPLSEMVDAGMYLIRISTPVQPVMNDIITVMPPAFSKEYP